MSTDFDTVEQWNEFFTTTFPEGALVSFMTREDQTQPDVSTMQTLVSGIQVIRLIEDTPLLRFFSAYNSRVFDFEVAEMQEQGEDWLVLTEGSAPTLLMSSRLSEAHKEVLATNGQDGTRWEA